MFLGHVFRLTDLLVQAHVEKAVGLLFALCEVSAKSLDCRLLVVGGFLALTFKRCDDLVGDCGFKRDFGNDAFYLGVDHFFPHEFLRAR
ncbi:MAG: hypothetical protein ABSG14_11015 [Verrucomicrobiia bacterium]